MALPRASASAVLAAPLLFAAGPRDAPAGEVEAEKNPCQSVSNPVAIGAAQWNGWGRDLDNSRYQPEPALRAADVPKLALKWAYGYRGGAVDGQPTVVDGRLFVTNASGRIYSLDARTGCTYWTYDAAAGVSGAVSIGQLAAPKKPHTPKSSRRKHVHTDAHIEVDRPPCAVFFGDAAGAVYALDAQRGTLLWKTQADERPAARITGAPTLYANRLYVPTTDSVIAIDIVSGKMLWKIGVPAGFAPTVDAARGVVYVATGDSGAAPESGVAAQESGAAAPLRDAIVAVDLGDGQPHWVKRAPGGAAFRISPILRHLPGGRQIMLAASGGTAFGLDPERAGEILWQAQVAPERPGSRIEAGPAADHRNVYVAASGGLTALDLATGQVRWSTPAPQPACSWGERNCSHSQSQAVTVMPGVAFSGSLDGHLRAYSTIDGKIVWDVDTAKEYRTVNDVAASGGSLGKGGTTVVDGVVYVNSGGGSGQPGNVLLAFSVDGK